jgi:hypothetical protein
VPEDKFSLPGDNELRTLDMHIHEFVYNVKTNLYRRLNDACRYNCMLYETLFEPQL